MFSARTCLIAVAVACACSAARAQELGPYPPVEDTRPTPVSSYTEVEFLEGSVFVSQEIDIALNGNLGASGFVIRLLGGIGSDDYLNQDVRGGKVDVEPVQLDFLLGYQRIHNNLYWSAYVGVDYLDYRLSPADPSNPLSGSETGVKVAGSLQTAEAKPVFAGVYGEFSSAYDTWFTQFRLGYSLGKVIVGPEAALLGDETFNSQRVGGWLYFPLKIAGNFAPDVYVTGGYSFVDDESGAGFSPGAGSGDGGYLTVGVGISF
jgi:Cellulose biosynthesis protein BcsS